MHARLATCGVSCHGSECYLDESTHPMTTPFRLDTRTALVTGGASGIGEATCRTLAGAGATVIVADVDPPRADALAAELPGAKGLNPDITNEAAVHEAIGTIARHEILVNNAGDGLVGN